MTSFARGKLVIVLTIKCDEALAAALDEEQRDREVQTGVPLSRSVVGRLLLEERLGLRERASPPRARE